MNIQDKHLNQEAVKRAAEIAIEIRDAEKETNKDTETYGRNQNKRQNKGDKRWKQSSQYKKDNTSKTKIAYKQTEEIGNAEGKQREDKKKSNILDNTRGKLTQQEQQGNWQFKRCY